MTTWDSLPRIAIKLLLLITGCTAWLVPGLLGDPDGGRLVACVLLALICSSVAEWLYPSRWTWCAVSMASAVGILWPVTVPALSPVAMDAGRLAAAMWGSDPIKDNARLGFFSISEERTAGAIPLRRTILRLLPLSLPFLPLAGMPLHAALCPCDAATRCTPPSGMPWTTSHAMLLLTLGTLSTLGMTCGFLLHERHRLSRLLLAGRDALRFERHTSLGRMRDADLLRAQTIRSATLDERTRIARDIHDNAGHLLTRAIMQTQAAMAVSAAQGDETERQRFEEIAVTLDEAMTTIRTAVHDLADAGTDFDAMMADAIASLPDHRLRVTMDNAIAEVPAPVARCFAAVIREALTNAAKHGTATTVRVTLRDMPALWQLSIQDNGAVPDRTRRHTRGRNHRGMGLDDIAQRARSLSGTSLCGWNGEGWRVFVSIPKRDLSADDRSPSARSRQEPDGTEL